VSYLRIDKKGVGLALKTAWLNSEAQVIGFMDLDFATSLNHMKEAFNSLEYNGFEIVCGSRNLQNSVVKNRKVSRTISSKALNAIIRTVFKTKFTDGMCGFKFLHKRNLPTILRNGLGFDGWFFSTEMLIVAEYSGLSIHDLAVNWNDNRNSKVRIARLSARYLCEIYKLKIHMMKTKQGANSRGFCK
jgi:glycosyltransferase involved in cell wall biosynthesis